MIRGAEYEASVIRAGVNDDGIRVVQGVVYGECMALSNVCSRYKLSGHFRYVAVGEKKRGCWGPDTNERAQGVYI